MTPFVEDLEEKCRRIVSKMQKQGPSSSPATFVGREMALLLDQVARVTKQREDQRK